MVAQLIDTVLERSVAPSFSSIGPWARRRLFKWPQLEQYDLSGRTVVLTGGTSGIGEAAALVYASLGARLVIVARSPEKTDATIKALKDQTGNQDIHAVLADLGQQDEVRRAVDELLDKHAPIDTLVHNAGALFNERRRVEDGTDLTVELMVATPFLMTSLLLPALTQGDTPGRVLTMSSGGMYTEGLRVEDLEMTDSEYQGAKQYARAKRAQVSLNTVWAERVSRARCVFHALHPGWVDTPGIQDALPGFSKVLQRVGLLRSAREGADTLVWLTADAEALESSGDFWHDRARRDPHMMARTRSSDTPEKRAALWQWCEQHTGCTPPEVT